MEEITEDAEIVARVAGLDIGKATLTACVRAFRPAVPAGKRRNDSLAASSSSGGRSPSKAGVKA